MRDFCDFFRPIAVTLLRLALGAIFLFHGSTKLSDLHQWTQNFVHMGFPGYTAYFIGGLEAVGGALLILGLFTRPFALLLAGDMLVAMLKVHMPGGPIWMVGRYETVMLLSAASFAIFAHGAGPWSVDAILFGGGNSRSRAARR